VEPAGKSSFFSKKQPAAVESKSIPSDEVSKNKPAFTELKSS